MNRILLGLASANYLLLALTVYLGILVEPAESVRDFREDAFRYHLPLGIGTALFTVFTECLVFTYFLGTSRWVHETTTAYRMGDATRSRSRRLRSRAVASAIVGILLIVASVASGAGAHTRVWPLWVHQALPALAYLYMLLAYRVQIGAIEKHIELTDEIMAEVTRIREDRYGPRPNGLITSATPQPSQTSE